MRLAGLIRRNFLRRRTSFVEDIVDAHADADSIPDMCHQVGSLHAQRERRVVDVMDEVVDFGRFEVHEAVNLRLGRRAAIKRKIGGVAAEDNAEVLIEMREKARKWKTSSVNESMVI